MKGVNIEDETWSRGTKLSLDRGQGHELLQRQKWDHVVPWVLHSDGVDSSCMVPKMKGASSHIHLKALARGKRTQRRVLLKNMPHCCHSSCHEESDVTREYVGEGELSKQRTQSEVAETLRCAGRGHICRDSIGELDCFSAHIRLRVPSKSEDKAEKGRKCKATDSRAMGLAAPWYRRGGTYVESSTPYSHGGRALVVKGADEVENAEANSKYQDKAEGQRPRNFIRPFDYSTIATESNWEPRGVLQPEQEIEDSAKGEKIQHLQRL
ncbi:hypothetical protein B296_00032948 [Ensete ventricosum]|uniref:Uncharacterized protein n=1 Tax=Ensete ventricosum TaxID=4639 RepID=A0A427ACD9_ENSVE|nr:hypothetical protein B296_00032948 [Ensete ventricosum]